MVEEASSQPLAEKKRVGDDSEVAELSSATKLQSALLQANADKDQLIEALRAQLHTIAQTMLPPEEEEEDAEAVAASMDDAWGARLASATQEVVSGTLAPLNCQRRSAPN
jgi:hypothetical protein